MIRKRTVLILSIGFAITLVISLLALTGADPIAMTQEMYNSHPERGTRFFSLMVIGLSITEMVVLAKSSVTLKLIFYPVLIAIPLGIIAGISTPQLIYGSSLYGIYKFNTPLFLIIAGIGVFVSLIMSGSQLFKE